MKMKERRIRFQVWSFCLQPWKTLLSEMCANKRNTSFFALAGEAKENNCFFFGVLWHGTSFQNKPAVAALQPFVAVAQLASWRLLAAVTDAVKLVLGLVLKQWVLARNSVAEGKSQFTFLGGKTLETCSFSLTNGHSGETVM